MPLDSMDNLDMTQNTIMLTTAAADNNTWLFGGKLYSDCENENSNSCNQSFSITATDTIPIVYNSAGYPVILESGAKQINHGSIFTSSSSLCIESNGMDSIFINSDFLVHTGNPFCHESPRVFPDFEVLNLQAILNSRDTNGVLFSTNDVMVSTIDSQLIYYYFKLNCLDVNDSSITMEIQLEGNAPYSLQDFVVMDNGGIINLSSPFVINLSNPQGIFDLYFSATNLSTNLVSNFALFQIGLPTTGFQSFCVEPFVMRLDNSVEEQASGNFTLEYMDEQGELYSPVGTSATSDILIFNDVVPHVRDGSNNPTVLASISYSGEMKNQAGDVLLFDNIQLTMALAYPAQ